MPAETREPAIQEIQGEAVRHLGFDQQEMDSWKRRSRISAALPRLQVGVQRDLKDLVSLSTRDSVSISGGDVAVGPNQSDFNQNFNQGTSFEVKALWQLNELVFNRDSLAVSNERRDWIRERNRTVQDVTEAYYARKRLRQELRIGGDPQIIREKKKILLDQMNATIDAYTGGWFSQQIDGDEKGRVR